MPKSIFYRGPTCLPGFEYKQWLARRPQFRQVLVDVATCRYQFNNNQRTKKESYWNLKSMQSVVWVDKELVKNSQQHLGNEANVILRKKYQPCFQATSLLSYKPRNNFIFLMTSTFGVISFTICNLWSACSLQSANIIHWTWGRGWAVKMFFLIIYTNMYIFLKSHAQLHVQRL